MKTRIFAVTLALLTFLMFCSPALCTTGHTDKESYMPGETVMITLDVPVSEYPQMIMVCDESWTIIRYLMAVYGGEVNLIWDQTGNADSPTDGPFYQVAPGFYGIYYQPYMAPSHFLICEFQILNTWGSGSTDKGFYSLGETVRVSVEGLSGGLYPYIGQLAIRKANGGGWAVRVWSVPEQMKVTFGWDQSGNATDPVNGPFYQVEPGFYEILWYPYGMHGYLVLSRFLICAQGPDLNADGTVDILDITLAASAYGSRVGEPRWISGADMAPHYDIIDIFDLVTIASHYGEPYA